MENSVRFLSVCLTVCLARLAAAAVAAGKRARLDCYSVSRELRCGKQRSSKDRPAADDQQLLGLLAVDRAGGEEKSGREAGEEKVGTDF